MDFTAFRDLLTKLNLTGKLNRNTPESNRQAIREFVARNSYWTFGATDIDSGPVDYDEIAAIMSAALGMTNGRFASNQPPYINPEVTASGLIELRRRLEKLAAAGGSALFATNHPGSLAGFYLVLAAHFTALGGEVVHLAQPRKAPSKRWLDQVGGVVILSDEGNLMHAHIGNGFDQLVKRQKPGLVIADHGFAQDAVNAGANVACIFDVDDPALAIAAHRYPNRVLAIPMNDNQTNIRSTAGAMALWRVTDA